MRLRRESAAWGAMTLILLVLFVLSTLGTKATVVAMVAALGVTAVISFGPDRVGTVVMLAAMFTAPLNGFRPTAGNITFSDLFFVLGIGLLLPRMLRGRPSIPVLYYIGSMVFLVAGFLASLIAPAPLQSVSGLARFAVAAMVLPLAMSTWRPSKRVLIWLASAYVVGQMVSTLYAYTKGAEAQGRYFGWTTHPNFFGMGGHTAYALLIFLFYQLKPKHRWVLLIPAAVVVQSVLMSGSRASLLLIALVTVAWPVVERSTVAWWVLLTGGVVGLVAANSILGSVATSSALGRIQGGLSADSSDEARTQLLHEGLHKFLDNPIIGHGFDTTVIDYHNVYLEVLIGGGIIALVGFVIMLVPLVSGLFRSGTPNRLCYVGLSYAAFAMIGPSLWDRIVWAGLALVFVQTADPDPDPDLTAPPESAELTHQGMHT